MTEKLGRIMVFHTRCPTELYNSLIRERTSYYKRVNKHTNIIKSRWTHYFTVLYLVTQQRGQNLNRLDSKRRKNFACCACIAGDAYLVDAPGRAFLFSSFDSLSFCLLPCFIFLIDLSTIFEYCCLNFYRNIVSIRSGRFTPGKECLSLIWHKFSRFSLLMLFDFEVFHLALQISWFERYRWFLCGRNARLPYRIISLFLFISFYNHFVDTI